MSFLGSFEHTTGKTWGGVQISPPILQATALLGGFFGLDHLLLRSPQTAFAKFITNILTLGLWYWYDVIQVFQDMDFIKQYGYTFPIKGPVGLGVGIVGDTSGPTAAPKGTPSPFMFLAYMALLFAPFGMSNFLAGDFQGGTAKFFLTFFIFTTILGLLWSFYSLLFASFNTQKLLTQGVDRFFPATLILPPFGPSPALTIPGVTKAEEALEEDSIFTKAYNMIFGFIEKPILETVVSVTEPIVDTAQNIKNIATNEAATTPPSQAGGGAFTTMTNTALLLAAGQEGGSKPDSVSQALFLGAAALVLVGSVSLTYARFWGAKKKNLNEDRNDIPPEGFQNDVPPGPGVL